MQRKRRFDESNGDDPDVQVLSVKKPKLNHSVSSGWFQSSVIYRMSQWVQDKFRWRSQKSSSAGINGNGNGVSMTGTGRRESSTTHHGFATVSRSYQQGKWPLDDRASGGTMSQSLSRPALHDRTSESPVVTLQPRAGYGGKRRDLFNTSRNKHRFTAGESVRLDDKVRYKQLLQKFTTVDLRSEEDGAIRPDIVKKGPSVPKLTKFFFCSNDSILGSSSISFDKPSKTEIESSKIKVRPERMSSPVPVYNGRKPEDDSEIQITDISVIPSVQKTTKSRKSDIIDLTDDSVSIVPDSCRNRNFKSPDYRDSKFVADTWIKDLKETYSAKARENERKIVEAELKAKIYSERRKEDNEHLERKIRQQMWIHRKEPVVIDDPPISDVESEEDEVEILEDKEEVLPELTDDMLNVINNALSKGNPSQVLVENSKLQITKADIATLSGLNWLNDERKEDNEHLERKIRQQMWIHRKEPVVIDDPPISDVESEEDEVEILEDKEEVLPELTDDMLNVINNALSKGNPSQVLVENFKLQITKADIATLSGLNWLNDEVINFYMSLLMQRGEKDGNAKVYAFNTFFYPKVMSGGQAAVRRWTRRVDVLAVDYILIPVHLGKHWCLAVINFKKKDIQYYDSMGGNNTQCLSALKKYLQDESLDKKKKEFDLEGWKTTMIKDIPQQMNGNDCGMFTCKYAEYITRNAPISFTQENMPYFRKRMVYEIVSSKLLQ